MFSHVPDDELMTTIGQTQGDRSWVGAQDWRDAAPERDGTAGASSAIIEAECALTIFVGRLCERPSLEFTSMMKHVDERQKKESVR